MNKDTTTLAKIQEIKSYAEKYILQGWNIVPLRYGTKSKFAVKSWKEYQTKKQTLAWLEDPVWNDPKNPRNIAIVCGRVSNNLVVIDCDSEKAIALFYDICSDIGKDYTNTYRVLTRRGIHYYYQIEGKVDKIESKQFDMKDKSGDKIHIDIQADGKLVMAPPNYFNSKMEDKDADEEVEHTYTALSDISALKVLTVEEYEELIKKLMEAFKQEQTDQLKRMLGDDEGTEEEQENFYIIDVEKLKELVIKNYQEGVRHYIVLYTSGFLRKNGFSYDDAIKFWEHVWEQVEDEERNRRLYDVKTTYEADMQSIAGYSKLKEYIPELGQCIKSQRKIPQEYDIHNGLLAEVKVSKMLIKINELCDYFYVKDKVVNVKDNTNVGYILKFPKKQKEVYISVDDLSRNRFAKTFSKYVSVVDDNTAQKILRYITKYSLINQEFIKTKWAVDTIGWINGDYYLPQLKENHYFVNLASGYGSRGEKEKEIELFTELVNQKSYLSLGYIIGIAGILLPLLNIDNFVVYAGGRTGAGKSTVSFLALSLFGNYELLKATNDNATVGFELFLKQRNHTLAVLDEVNTSVGDVEKVAENLIRNIYKFSSKQGRMRATTDITLREQVRFEGMLYISAEDDLKTFLKLNKRTVKGVLRRTILIDFEKLYQSWGGEENLQSWAEMVYVTIKENYGNMLRDIVEKVKSDIDKIKEDFKNYVSYYKDIDQGWQFEGQERAFALLCTATRFLERHAGLGFDFIYKLIDEIATMNNQEFTKGVRTSKGDLIEEIEAWISENYGFFKVTQTREEEVERYDESGQKKKERKVVETTEKQPVKVLFGKIEDQKLFLTNIGLTSLAKYLQMSEIELKRTIAEFGLAEKDEVRGIKRTMKTIDGIALKVYEIKYSFLG